MLLMIIYFSKTSQSQWQITIWFTGQAHCLYLYRNGEKKNTDTVTFHADTSSRWLIYFSLRWHLRAHRGHCEHEGCNFYTISRLQLKYEQTVSLFRFLLPPALSVLTPPVLRPWSRGARDMTQCASPHSSHSQEGQCHQEFRFRVVFYLASEGEQAKTTNKRIYLPTFPMQIKNINTNTKSYLTPKWGKTEGNGLKKMLLPLTGLPNSLFIYKCTKTLRLQISLDYTNTKY